MFDQVHMHISLTLMVMEIMVVSSSSVSMYSIYPFETNSCQPSSGVSWISGQKDRRSFYEEKKLCTCKVSGSQHMSINARPYVAKLLYAPS